MKGKQEKKRKGSIVSKIIMIVAIISIAISYLYNTKLPSYIALKKKEETIKKQDRRDENKPEWQDEKVLLISRIEEAPKKVFQHAHFFFYKKPLEYGVDTS